MTDLTTLIENMQDDLARAEQMDFPNRPEIVFSARYEHLKKCMQTIIRHLKTQVEAKP